jgi:predicted permease
MLERLRLRVRALLQARAMEEELDEELRYHLERESERNVARGMSPGNAAAAARRAFGNPTQLKEQVRDSWGRHWLEHLEQDARYALRSFRRAPAFSSTVVLTIALALGLNTTAFTIFNAYVLRPIAVRDPSSLFQLTWIDRGGASHGFSWDDYRALRANRDAISETFAYRFVFSRIDSTPAFGQLVSGNYFSMLGVGATLGRTLVTSDAAAPGAESVVVLSHSMWQSRFGGDSSIVGKTIRVRGHALQVIGVAAPGFGGLGDVPLDFWAPITMSDVLFEDENILSGDGPERVSLVGRLRSNIEVGQAEAWLASWMRARRLNARERDIPAGADLVSRATSLPLSPEFALFFAPIAAAFVLVLLIACADVANMMLARGMSRQRELGIRLSLGAARERLIAQLLTESVLLAMPAALIGFVISRLTVHGGVRLMFQTMSPEVLPYMRVVPLAPDGRVFCFMLIAAVVSAVLFGLAPALQATRPNIIQATRGDFDTDFRPSRLRNTLVVGQVAVCVLLLICAGVLVRDVRRMQNLDIGVRTHGIVRLDLDERRGVRTRVLAVPQTHPDIHRLAAASDAPFGRRFPTIAAAADDGQTRETAYNYVTASYFSLLGIPIVRGRNFTGDEERAGASVVIVSEGTARAFWPGRDPIGQTLHRVTDTIRGGQWPFAPRRSARVVGVVPNVVLGTIIDPFDAPVAYYPVADSTRGTALLAAVTGRAEVTMRRIDADVSRRVPSAIEDIHTLDAYMAGGVYPFRAAYWIAGVLGAIALLLTLSGVYGVLSYVVAQRRKELGIRVALGASASTVIALVLSQAVRLCAIGLGIGSLLSLGVSRIFAANIVRLETFEPVAFVGGALVVLICCIVASYVPARRAARIDPVDALRGD